MHPILGAELHVHVHQTQPFVHEVIGKLSTLGDKSHLLRICDKVI